MKNNRNYQYIKGNSLSAKDNKLLTENEVIKLIYSNI